MDDGFPWRVPRCAECGEMIPPSGSPDNIAVLRLPFRHRQREFDFHAACAPTLCKPGHVTTLSDCVVDESAVGRWEKHQ